MQWSRPVIGLMYDDTFMGLIQPARGFVLFFVFFFALYRKHIRVGFGKISVHPSEGLVRVLSS